MQARAELEQLAGDRPTLAELARELGDVLAVLYAEPFREQAPGIDAEQAQAKVAAGIPIFRGETLVIDEAAFRRRWRDVCAVLGRRCPDAARLLANALTEGRLDPAWHLVEILAGRVGSIHARAESLGLDVPLTASVWWLALWPVMGHLREALSVGPASGWRQGFCPVCGSWPRLGEFRGLEQTRWLRCGLCAAEWEFPRLCCVFCGNSDHRTLGYFHVEGQADKQRAATCEKCRHYVKTVATLSALSGPRLLVADLATTHLDLAAADRGYLPPGADE
jgi:FdhE protein